MLQRLLIGLTLLSGVMFATPASACECSTSPVDPQAYLHDATLVFEGEVLDRPFTDWLFHSAVFRVLTPMKGRLGEQVVLDQSRAGNCGADFSPGERVRIVAFGTAASGYWTSACSLNYLHPTWQGEEIWPLAAANHQRTVDLGGTDLSATDVPTLRRLVRWHAEYGSFEEGLDAAERLLVFEPNDPEATQLKAEFLATIERKRKKLW